MSKKTNPINELASAELEAKLIENREKLLHLRLRKQTGQVEKTHELRILRKDIARIEPARTAKNKKAAA
jgi:large subunit ribosomal protein L29